MGDWDDYAALTDPAGADTLLILDVSATPPADGTVKQVTVSDLLDAAVPVTQSFSLANNAYQPIYEWTVTGQTDDPVPAFGEVAVSKTYGTSPAIQGPFAVYGFNPELAANPSLNNGYGAAVASFFADAGDTNVSGAHGLEVNLSYFPPNGSPGVAAFQFVAVNDNTSTVKTRIACGTGAQSNIVFQNGDASTVYMLMGPTVSDQVQILRPVTMSGATFSQNVAGNGSLIGTATGGIFTIEAQATGNASLIAKSTGASQTAQVVANSTGTSGLAKFTLDAVLQNYLIFNLTGATKWELIHTSSVFAFFDFVNSRQHQTFTAGATSLAALTNFASRVQVQSSLLVNNNGSVLAATATDGFLYIPAVAAAPTGTPTAVTGGYPVCCDGTKIYAYAGGAWKGAALS